MLLGYDDEGRAVMISNEGNLTYVLLWDLKFVKLPDILDILWDIENLIFTRCTFLGE